MCACALTERRVVSTCLRPLSVSTCALGAVLAESGRSSPVLYEVSHQKEDPRVLCSTSSHTRKRTVLPCEQRTLQREKGPLSPEFNTHCKFLVPDRRVQHLQLINNLHLGAPRFEARWSSRGSSRTLQPHCRFVSGCCCVYRYDPVPYRFPSNPFHSVSH